MEKENIKTITIEDFKNSQHILDYLDDDFAIVNSLDGIPYSNEIVRLECFLIAVCIEGCIQLDINNKTYQLQPGDLLLGLPNTIIGHTMMSPKYKIRLAGFSTRFLQRILKIEKDTWDTAIHIHNNPIKSISKENDNNIFKYYGELIMAKINDEPHCYHKAVVQHLFSALFARCWVISTRKWPNRRKLRSRKKALNKLIISYGSSWCYCRKIMECTVR